MAEAENVVGDLPRASVAAVSLPPATATSPPGAAVPEDDAASPAAALLPLAALLEPPRALRSASWRSESDMRAPHAVDMRAQTTAATGHVRLMLRNPPS